MNQSTHLLYFPQHVRRKGFCTQHLPAGRIPVQFVFMLVLQYMPSSHFYFLKQFRLRVICSLERTGQLPGNPS